jgi:hypothetical protein
MQVFDDLIIYNHIFEQPLAIYLRVLKIYNRVL